MGLERRPRQKWLRGPVIASAAALMISLIVIGVILIRRSWQSDPLSAGKAAYQRGDYAAASQLARTRLQITNNDADALRLLARSALRLGDEPRAERIYKSLGDDGLGGEDFYLLGLDQHRRGDQAGAVNSWELGVTKDAGHTEMLAILAQSLGELDRFTPAMLVVKQLMNQPNEAARANLILGELYNMMNAPAQAAIALERGLDETGKSIERAEAARIRRLLAHCLLRAGRPAEARQTLEHIGSRQQQDDPETAWLLSRCDLQQGREPDASTQRLAQTYREEFPLVPEPAPYVGAAKCARCHRANFDLQQHSRHGRTFCTAQRISGLAFLPAKPVADPGNHEVTHAYRRVDDHVEVQTQVGDRVVRTIVDYAFGSGDRGLTPVGHDEKNHLFESRLSYYSHHGGWDVTSGQSVHPDDAVSYQGSLLNLDVVRRCILCHQTNPMAVLTQRGPEAADPAIGCEKCHGPGGNHVRVAEISPPPRDLAIARPSLARGEPVVQLCGQCHDPRKTETRLSPLLETAIRFQASSLTWSRCYVESARQLDCVTCHNPHRDAETFARPYERKCLECHSGKSSAAHSTVQASQPRFASPVVGNVCPVQPDSGCISCHMPKKASNIPHSLFTDHFIRVRRDGGPENLPDHGPSR